MVIMSVICMVATTKSTSQWSQPPCQLFKWLRLQDHVVAGVLLSKRDTFLTRGQFMQLLYAACCSSRPGADAAAAVGKLDVPPPALWAPQRLYTGKQVSVVGFFDALCGDAKTLASEVAAAGSSLAAEWAANLG